MINIVAGSKDTRMNASLVRASCEFLARHSRQPQPTWVREDFSVYQPQPSDVLWVNELDLKQAKETGSVLPWQPINILVVETLWQLKFYSDLLDQSRCYVVICDSHVSKSEVSRFLPGINIVDTFCVFQDVMALLDRLAFFDAEYRPLQIPVKHKPYRTFAYVGRADLYRDRLVRRLMKARLPQSMVKYGGAVIVDNAPDLDTLDYRDPSFHSPSSSDLRFGSIIPQTRMYAQYQFETAIETTAWQEGGWPATEYTITEKTFKPLLAGVPCVMLAPCGYHSWLESEFGIDIAAGCFDHSWDLVESDNDRLDEMSRAVIDLVDRGIDEPDPIKIAHNRRAMIDLSDFVTKELARCAQWMATL